MMGHTHNFNTTPLLGKPAVTVGSEYPRAGSLITVGIAQISDSDTCQNPGCSYAMGIAWNNVKVTAWSDGGAGGQFGKLVNGVFQTCPAEQVTHYKAGTAPQVVNLTVTVDDIPYATDNPNLFTADDPATTSDPKKITNWEFTITDGAAGWLPALDSTRDFTAALAPATDHNNNSLARTLTFILTSSQEPGYCCNATRQSTPAQQTDTVGFDLKFLPPQTGLTIDPANDLANTATAVTTATARVTCLDYGAHGQVRAETSSPPMGPVVRARLVGSMTQEDAQMPVDVNGNSIADSSSYDGSGAAPNQDLDTDPAGNNVNGDALSRYEEYRGLIVQGSRLQLDLSKKEVFVRNDDGLDASVLTTAKLGATSTTSSPVKSTPRARSTTTGATAPCMLWGPKKLSKSRTVCRDLCAACGAGPSEAIP